MHSTYARFKAHFTKYRSNNLKNVEMKVNSFKLLQFMNLNVHKIGSTING